MEKWEPVPGYERTYEVSSRGRVRRIAAASGTREGRLRKLVDRGPYKQVVLSKNDEQELKRVHRLVARAFLGEPPTCNHEVNHLNGNGKDNCVENLEWVSHSENLKHAYDTGLCEPAPSLGSDNGNAILSEADVREIRQRVVSERQADLAREYGVARQTIWKIVHGQAWKHVD